MLAKRLLEDGWRVSGTTRNPGNADALRRLGITVHGFNGHPLDDITALRGATHLLSSIPPDSAGDPAYIPHRDMLERSAPDLRWIGYLSTTGVYGDQEGRWIDETCPAAPMTKGSQYRVLAEGQWLSLGRKLGVTAHVFRLPGIYGPGGRNQVEALRAGTARRIVKPGHVFNRIHVEDLASVVIASMYAGRGSPIYNVVDDEPAQADEVVAHAAQLLGMQPPPAISLEDAKLSPFAAHFYAECKRVRNDLIKSELGVTLRYPSYREGLAAVAAAGFACCR